MSGYSLIWFATILISYFLRLHEKSHEDIYWKKYMPECHRHRDGVSYRWNWVAFDWEGLFREWKKTAKHGALRDTKKEWKKSRKMTFHWNSWQPLEYTTPNSKPVHQSVQENRMVLKAAAKSRRVRAVSFCLPIIL